MTIRHYEPRDLGEIIRLFNDYRVFYEQDSDIKLAERRCCINQGRGEAVLTFTRNDMAVTL
ncbi:hypothetical protein [Ralstonia pseudosolanacearum]|uniref:hypothetical protein n=1 Tax=Ralstonia pseudosolanacearum TaxID=1310165 RepID=UPI003CF815D3